MSTRGKENKPHIGIFGQRNFGKSSLINLLAGQEIAIVSDTPGTTTDPVKKSMEIPGLGPVILVDTAGIDDLGELGRKRVGKTMEVLQTLDLGILLLTENRLEQPEEDLIRAFEEADLPYFFIHNKSDIHPLDHGFKLKLEHRFGVPVLSFSARQQTNLQDLINTFRDLVPETAYTKRALVGDLIARGDVVLLITPIDSEAPEGRMILPQMQVIRDVLDHDGVTVVCKETEVEAMIRQMKPKPCLAITDSQVFPKADAYIPKDIPLTSFSIVLARQKGDFSNYLKGTPAISDLKDGDKVLILESCTHHVSCDDIGRVKIPRWLSNFTGKKLDFEVVAGLNKLPDDLKSYALVIQCGGCVITRKQVVNRIRMAVKAGVPVTNYGMAIAWVHGIYHRAVAPFIKTGESTGDYL